MALYCTKCGAAMPDDAGFCARCGQPVTAPAAGAPHVVVVREAKSPGLAVVLSFLVSGLGQIYNGEIGKGIGFLIAYGLAWVLTGILIGFLIVPVIWIWSMVDAYKRAEEINRQVNARYGV